MRSAAMIVVGWAAAAMAGGGECDPSYECIYRHGSSDGTSYMFDFSQLCSSTDHVASDSLGHTYYAQICGNANQNCLPASYTETYEYGVAVQMWGDTPSCSPPGCNDPATGRAVCCTASCAVRPQRRQRAGRAQWGRRAGRAQWGRRRGGRGRARRCTRDRGVAQGVASARRARARA